MSIFKKKRKANPQLTFSPYAWAKLLFLRDRGDTEVGGFGICHSDNLLHVSDFQLVQQSCTPVTVEFDDESVADFFDAQVDAGRQPEQFARVWIHTHPGDSASPSSTDEDTFARVFGSSQWAMMFILAQEGECYARLQFNVGPGIRQELEVAIDYSQPFDGTNWEAWEQEYLACVQAPQRLERSQSRWREEGFTLLPEDTPPAWRDAWHGYSDEDFQEAMAYE